MKKTILLKQFAVATAICLFTFMGCEDIVDPDYVSPEDSAAAAVAVATANTSLEALVSAVINTEPDSVQAMLDLLDFSAPYALFVEAHDLDPRNADANFGLAFTGFMMLSQDSQLQEMLLRWEAYFNIHEAFAVTDPQPDLARVGLGMPLSLDGIRLEAGYFIQTPLALSRMSVDDVPQFSEFQSLIDGLFLPVINESIAALDFVDDNEDFEYLISSAMQGDPEADPIELDLTEVFALETALYSLGSVLNTAAAYNFDFVSFDSAGIVSELSQHSDFATLKQDGAADLLAAKAFADMAFVKALAALTFLENETDDQSNDMMVFDDEDPIKLREDILEAQSAFNEPTLLHYSYWEDVYENDNWIDEQYIEDSVFVDISQFYENPILDFKAMLPPYSMGTTFEYEYQQTSVIEYFQADDSQITITGLDNAPITIDFSYDESDYEHPMSAWVILSGIYFDLMTATQNELPPSVWELYAEFQGLIDEYSGELYFYPIITFYWTGNLTTGSSLVIEGDVYIYYDERGTAYVVPDPQWEATSYNDWLIAWPDPTMHGIFPDFEAADLADFLGFTEENWDNLNN